MGEQGGKHQNGFPRILAEDVIHAYPTLCSSHSTYSYNSERLHLYPAFQAALLLHSPFWPGIPDSRSCTTCALYSIHFSHPPLFRNLFVSFRVFSDYPRFGLQCPTSPAVCGVNQA